MENIINIINFNYNYIIWKKRGLEDKELSSNFFFTKHIKI